MKCFARESLSADVFTSIEGLWPAGSPQKTIKGQREYSILSDNICTEALYWTLKKSN